ncbi:MAG: alpha-L-rhamnosidase N-terminal domain-containing protein [Bacteroidales bacterium]|nr:alpha-L-rhamnosidase N-terminal domain-containing protein [Bacteroidales bacterium]
MAEGRFTYVWRLPCSCVQERFHCKKRCEISQIIHHRCRILQCLSKRSNYRQNILDPAWTNYSRRVYYSEYDITQDLHPGKNCIGTTIGNGFFNPLPMKMWSTYNLRDYLPVGKPMFIASLKITYDNGEIEEINTNSGWKYSYGAVIRNSVYLGEVYDAGKEIKGWNTPDFDDKGWETLLFTAVPVANSKKPSSLQFR